MENEEITQFILLQTKISDRCKIIADYIIKNDLKFQNRITGKWEIHKFVINKGKISIMIDDFPGGFDIFNTIDIDMSLFMSQDYMLELTNKIDASNIRYNKIIQLNEKSIKEYNFSDKKNKKAKFNS